MRKAMFSTPKGKAYTHSITLCHDLLQSSFEALLLGAYKPFLDIPSSQIALSFSTIYNLVPDNDNLFGALNRFRPEALEVRGPTETAEWRAAELNLTLQTYSGALDGFT